MSEQRPLCRRIARPPITDQKAQYRANTNSATTHVWAAVCDYSIDVQLRETFEHFVFGRWCLPADLAVKFALRALEVTAHNERIELYDVRFTAPLVAEDAESSQLLFEQAIDNKSNLVRAVSKKSSDQSLMVHFTARYRHVQSRHYSEQKKSIQSLLPTFAESDHQTSVEASLPFDGVSSPIKLGRGYGSLTRISGDAYSGAGRYAAVPENANFDDQNIVQALGACFAAVISSCEDSAQSNAHSETFLPIRISAIHVARMPETLDWTVRWELEQRQSERLFLANVTLYDGHNNPIVALQGVQLIKTKKEAFIQRSNLLRDFILDDLNKSKYLHETRVTISSTKPEATDETAKLGADNTASNQIAVIGMAGRFPGATNIDEFWQNLCDSQNSITDVPSDRWREFSDWYNPDKQSSGTASSKSGGFVDGVDQFDPEYFKISKADAILMDPHQRLMLQESIRAFQNSGLDGKRLAGQNCGVFVGCTKGDYDKVLEKVCLIGEGKAFVGTTASLVAANIAYHLDLDGPTFVVDTACSSSLTAVHLACENIANNNCDLALVGGVNLFLSPISHIHTSQVGMQSSKGLCRAFDANADGTVFSEACAAVVLKRLDLAIADGDPIAAVINGSAINQDGRTNGITAPSSRAQSKLISQVHKRAGIEPTQVDYVEAHGTATPLGDPIEVKALQNAYGLTRDPSDKCLIGSVKSNIGHCSYAAGIVGLIKCVLCLKHERIPSSLHYDAPNKHIEFEKTPFVVADRLISWPASKSKSRYCSVSSFGFGGSNAHVLLSSAVTSSENSNSMSVKQTQNDEFLLPISAASIESLFSGLDELQCYLLKRIPKTSCFIEPALTLENLAFALELRRDARQYRALIKANSLEQLLGTLKAINSNTSNQVLASIWFSDNVNLPNQYSQLASVTSDMSLLSSDQQSWLAYQNRNLNRYSANVEQLSLPGYAFRAVKVWPVSSHMTVSPEETVQKDVEYGLEGESASSTLVNSQKDKTKSTVLRKNTISSEKFIELVERVLMAEPKTLHLDLYVSDLGIDSINVKGLVQEVNVHYQTRFRVANFFACKSLRSLFELVSIEVKKLDKQAVELNEEESGDSRDKNITEDTVSIPVFDNQLIRASRFYRDIISGEIA